MVFYWFSDWWLAVPRSVSGWSKLWWWWLGSECPNQWSQSGRWETPRTGVVQEDSIPPQDDSDKLTRLKRGLWSEPCASNNPKQPHNRKPVTRWLFSANMYWWEQRWGERWVLAHWRWLLPANWEASKYPQRVVKPTSLLWEVFREH